MLRVTVEADVAGIGLQGRAKCEFCVPAIEMNGESYRLRQSKQRQRDSRCCATIKRFVQRQSATHLSVETPSFERALVKPEAAAGGGLKDQV
jgi:hypothetical protein